MRSLQVVNYVIEKMVLDKPLEGETSDGTLNLGRGIGQLQFPSLGDGSIRSGLKPWQKLKPSIEILCNNQASLKEELITNFNAALYFDTLIFTFFTFRLTNILFYSPFNGLLISFLPFWNIYNYQFILHLICDSTNNQRTLFT